MAQLVISAAGAGVGFLLGGPTGAQIGWVAGSAIGSALFPTKAPSGPRLADLKVSGSAYGAPIPYVEGHPRVAGQVIWESDKYAVTTESGGKGGPNVETETTIYKVDLLLLLSSNEIAGVRRVWSNGALVWTAADDATGESLIASDATEHWDALTVYGGSASQLPDPIYEAAVGSGNAPAYRGRGTVMIEALNLGSSGILPNLTFEVVQASTEGVYSSAILYAPLADDEDDIIAPAATVTLYGPTGISYDGTEVTLDSTVPAANVAMKYAENKLYANDGAYAGQRITMRVEASVVTVGANFADKKKFFSYTAGSVDFWFALSKDAGVITLHSAYYSGGTVYENHGAAPTTGVYDLVFDEDGTTFHWVLDGVTLRSLTVARPAGDLTIATVYNYGNGVEAMAFNGLQFYVGDAPFTATTYTADDAPLDDVVERLCVRAGLTTGQVDVTALSGQSVRSLAVAQVTPTRSVLELLAGAYQFEAVESLGKLKFVSRGGSSAATIAYASMGAGREGATAEPLPLTMLNDVETPAQVTVRYVNASNDYQDGAESSDRLLGPGIGVQVYEVPVGLTPAEARTLADVQIMDVAASQRKFGPVSLSNDYAHLEPTDVVTLTDTDASTYRGRVLTMRSGGGVHTIEGVIEDASILTSTIATDSDYDESADVAGAVETVLELLDIPLLRDDDDGPGFYAAFKGAATPWPGCVLFGSADGVTYTQIGSAIAEATQIGECTTTLGDWTGGTVFDEKNSVTVDVGDQTLASWSRDEILAGTATGYVIGSELLYARTATLSSPGVYVLTGLLRGRRGTEWAIAGHAASERFVALPASGRGLRRVTISATDIGVTRYYKAVTAGRALSTATAQTLACAGVSQKPFAPVDLRASVSDSAVEVTWTRRTRYATRFAGTGGISVPLGETSEAYEIDLYDNVAAFVGTHATSEPALSIAALSASFSLVVPCDHVQDVSGDIVGAYDKYPSANYSASLVRHSAAGVHLGGCFVGDQITALANVGSDVYAAVINGAGTAYVYRVATSTLTIGATLSAAATYTATAAADPQGVVYDGTDIWISESSTGQIRRLNASTLAVLETQAINAGIGALAYAAGSIWICDRLNSQIVEWSIAGAAEVQRIDCVYFPSDIIVDNGLAFVAGSTTIGIYDTTTGNEVNSTSGGAQTQFRTALAQTSTHIWGCDYAAHQFVQFNPTTGDELLRIYAADLYGLAGVDGDTLFGSFHANDAGSAMSTVAYVASDDLTGYSLEIYQMSATIGRGYSTTIDI